MKKPGLILLGCLLCAAGMALSAAGGEPMPSTEGTPALRDLTLENLFSAGWDEDWRRRSRGEETPDMSLLRAQTNFLSRLARIDYSYQDALPASREHGVDGLLGTLEYALNRRIMVAAIGTHQWIDSKEGENRDGGAAGGFVRMQLIDAAHQSLDTTFKATLPSHDFRIKTTALNFGIAGWQDLAPLGLKRMGLYASLQEETLAGPSAPGSRRNLLSYDVSVAKTWTSPESWLGNASTFVEAYGTTALDGAESGRTDVTLTPGVRATIAKRHIVMAGVEFPITTPRPFERVVRVTYIYNF